MSPLGIEIMLFYYCRAEGDFDFSPPAQRELLGCYIDKGMIYETFSEGRKYDITDKGKFYVEHLTNIPLPTTTYVIN